MVLEDFIFHLRESCIDLSRSRCDNLEKLVLQKTAKEHLLFNLVAQP